MRKIIVPVDFSGDSLKAFHKAVYMAKKLSAEIHLLHVKKTRSFASIFSSQKEEKDVNIEQSFQEMLSSVKPDGVNVIQITKSGSSVSKEIVKYADSQEAYLIIMGTHGVSGFEEFWMGSNAYRVVSSADCPVLSMRGADNFIEISKIVLPIDLSATTRQKVPFTLDLAKHFNAEVHVIGTCIDETDEFVMKLTSYTGQVARFLTEKGIKVATDFIKGDNVTTMTIDYAKKIDADLIAIMTDQETSMLNAFLGAYAQQMVNHSPIPVVSMHKNTNLEGNISIM
ncbi:MAG: universal stress protein [Sphingobacteriales bacterium]|nr:MAG: universal stress protein [Sphingobacteriales bacterium]